MTLFYLLRFERHKSLFDLITKKKVIYCAEFVCHEGSFSIKESAILTMLI